MKPAHHRHLFLAQRYSAMLLAPMVLLHLALVIIAVRNGLTGEEILSRTRGSYLWGAFYFAFVLTVSIHAPIGVRNILREWTSINSGLVDALCVGFAIVLLFTGLRAVVAVV